MVCFSLMCWLYWLIGVGFGDVNCCLVSSFFLEVDLGNVLLMRFLGGILLFSIYYIFSGISY